MSVEPTLSDRLKAFSVGTTMMRGDLGHGKKAKTKKGALAKMAEYGPVDTHFYDQTTGETTIQTVHDVTAILEDNKRQRLDDHDGYSPSRELRKVATIPAGVVAQLFAAGINVYSEEGWEYVKALLDTKDYEALRTSDGKIGAAPIRTHFHMGTETT